MLLLMAIVAAWVPYVRFRQQIPAIEQQIASMREMAYELVIEDPKHIAIVKLPKTWYEEKRWDIYLPEGGYELRLATHEVDASGFPSATEQSLLSAGRHRIEFRQSRKVNCWKFTVMVDDRPSIEAIVDADWDSNHGSQTQTGYGERSVQVAPDKPVILFRRRFMQPTGGDSSTTPQGPTEGVMLWIERIGEDDSEPPVSR